MAFGPRASTRRRRSGRHPGARHRRRDRDLLGGGRGRAAAAAGARTRAFSFLDLRDYRDQNAVLEGLAAFTNWTANLTGTGDPERLEGVRRRPEPPKDEIPQAHFRMVMPDYFGVMGISLIEGREFNDGDRETTRRVAVISRAFADRHWRGRPAVGDHLVVGRETLEIIGVCEDVKQFGLDGDPTADLYVPLRQAPPS